MTIFRTTCCRIFWPMALVLVAACATAAVQSDPLAPAFKTGLCPSTVAMPDTVGPLKILPTRIRWADEGFESEIRVRGHVLARVTVDTTGHVEPGSTVIETSDNPELSVAYCSEVLRQRFAPYRVEGAARRVRVNQSFRMIAVPR